jgi:hypothetical protein
MAKKDEKKTELKVKPSDPKDEKAKAKGLLAKHPEIMYNARNLFHNENGETIIEESVPRGDEKKEDVIMPRTQSDLTDTDLREMAVFASSLVDDTLKQYDQKVAYEDALQRAIGSKDGGKYAGKVNASTFALIMDNMGKKKQASGLKRPTWENPPNYKAEPDAYKCDTCDFRGDEEADYVDDVHKLRTVTPDILKRVWDLGIPVPQDRKFLLSGGYGALAIDGFYLFLTKDQASKFPGKFCNECMLKILEQLTNIIGFYNTFSKPTEKDLVTMNNGHYINGWPSTITNTPFYKEMIKRIGSNYETPSTPSTTLSSPEKTLQNVGKNKLKSFEDLKNVYKSKEAGVYDQYLNKDVDIVKPTEGIDAGSPIRRTEKIVPNSLVQALGAVGLKNTDYLFYGHRSTSPDESLLLNIVLKPGVNVTFGQLRKLRGIDVKAPGFIIDVDTSGLFYDVNHPQSSIIKASLEPAGNYSNENLSKFENSPVTAINAVETKEARMDKGMILAELEATKVKLAALEVLADDEGTDKEAAETFKCPKCGTKVLAKTGYCVKCKEKVKGGDKKEDKKEDEKKEDKKDEKEAGAPPTCKKCGKKHFPFKKCDGEDKKEATETMTAIVASLDEIAGTLEAQKDFDLFKIAYEIDKVSDVLSGKKEAATLESDTDEKYMREYFKAGMREGDSDEKAYMSEFNTDMSTELNNKYPNGLGKDASAMPYKVVK